MFKFWRYVTRNVWRNPIRTVLTVFGVGVAVFVVTYLFAIFDSRSQLVAGAASTMLVVQEQDVYWPTKSMMPGDVDMARRIEQEVPRVVAAAPVYIKMNLWASSGGGLVKIVGIDKAQLRDFIELDVDPQKWESFLAKRNGALLGCDIVDKYRDRYVWEEGTEFAMADFDGLSLYMAGVFTPRDPAYRNVILTDRVFLQEVDEQRGVSNQLFVKIDDRDHAGAVCSAVDSLDFPVNIHTEPARVALDQAIDDLNDMLRYAGYVIVFTALVILMCIANTISMSTYDRSQEIGILRSLGFERPRIMRLVLAESILLSFLGGALGCLTAYLMLNLTQQQLIMRGHTIPLVMRPILLASGVGASLLVGLIGGFLPAMSAARLNIVKSLRNVE